MTRTLGVTAQTHVLECIFKFEIFILKTAVSNMLGTVLAAVSNASIGDWLLVTGGLLLVLYFVGTWNYDYFQRRGIPSTKPRLPFSGDYFRIFTGLESFNDGMEKLYKKGKGHGVFGTFEIITPIFLIRDPELVKIVGVKEFDSFVNHRSFASAEVEPIFGKNLFNIKDQAWREMRNTLSPAFTTSKIKAMLSLISQCSEQMVQHLTKKYHSANQGASKQRLETDMKDLFSRMANDVIATAAFGLKCDSLNYPENNFYTNAKKMMTFGKIRTLLIFFFMALPKLVEMLRIRLLDAKSASFFDSLVHETINERQKKGIFRPDVLQLLMQAREGQLKADKEDAQEAEDAVVNTKRSAKFSNDDISAQAILFFFAGYETVSTALCLSTFALSHDQEAQKKLQEEIDQVVRETDGNITYEALHGMKYMDAVINETLRLYPPVATVDRVCQNDISLTTGTPPKPVTIKKGSVIQIPIAGIHRDPQNWEDPMKFNPERFLDDNKQNIKPYTFLPFGVGPRICIGQRFALVEVKLALLHLLSNFDLHASAKTKYPLEYKGGGNVMAKGGFWCELSPRVK